MIVAVCEEKKEERVEGGRLWECAVKVFADASTRQAMIVCRSRAVSMHLSFSAKPKSPTNSTRLSAQLPQTQARHGGSIDPSIDPCGGYEDRCGPS